MTGVGDRVLVSGGREPSEVGATRASHAMLGAVVLCVLPVFAHGCHRGDHDDEPAVAPIENRAELPRPSQ